MVPNSLDSLRGFKVIVDSDEIAGHGRHKDRVAAISNTQKAINQA